MLYHISDIDRRRYYLANSSCACCGKSLVDPISMKYGIGPVCRKTHGFDKPDAEADWKRLRPIAGLFFANTDIQEIVGVNLQEAVSKKRADLIVQVLLRYIALFGANSKYFTNCCDAITGIKAAGWDRLAERVVKRYAEVKIAYGTDSFKSREGREITYKTIEVYAPYDGLFINEMRKVNAKWNREKKCNVITAKKYKEVWRAIFQCFKGRIGSSDKTPLFVIGA